MPPKARAFALLIAALLLATAPGPRTAGAAQTLPPPPLADGGTARVAAVIDGDTVTLADGRQVRLVGIQAPKLPPGRPGQRAWPLAEAARQALAALVAGREVRLGYGGRRQDRHGRLLAHLYVDGAWAQGEMLRRGLARVYTFADNRLLAAEMLALEGEARAARRGIWAEPFYAVRAPGALDARADAGAFAVVEGRVHDAAVVGRRVYLNFGADYRSDFTAVVVPEARPLFAEAGVDPVALTGRIVRVRGWVDSLNGPMIEITHPEQIEVAP